MTSGDAHLHEVDLPADVLDRHRAVRSIIEELEAVDWYDQRAAATGDEALAAVLRHNRDEEKEHAVMTLEWLRRHDGELDRVLRLYLFTEGPITAIEEQVEQADEPRGSANGDGAGLGIGRLHDGDDGRSW